MRKVKAKQEMHKRLQAETLLLALKTVQCLSLLIKQPKFLDVQVGGVISIFGKQKKNNRFFMQAGNLLFPIIH
jgi:hypothetical protein